MRELRFEFSAISDRRSVSSSPRAPHRTRVEAVVVFL